MAVTIDLSKVSWDRVPNPNRWPWYYSYQIRQTAARALGVATVVGLGSSYLISRTTKNPSFSYLTLVASVVMGLLAIVLKRWPLSPADPYHSLKQREEIRNHLQTDPHYGYKDMPDGVLTRSEINIILRSSLEAQPYSEFIQRHGQGATQVLNAENDAFMHAKCRTEKKEAIYQSLRDNPQYGYKDIVGAYLSKGELNVAFAADVKRQTYSEFITRHGIDVLAILNPLNLQNLRLKCRAHLLERKIAGENPEIPAVFQFAPEELDSLADITVLRLKQRKESPKAFVESSPDLADLSHPEAIAYALSPYRETILNHRVPFTVHAVHEARLATKDPACQEALRAKFFKLPYLEMADPKYDVQRKYLSITADEIKQTVEARWRNASWIGDFPDREGFYAALGTLFPPEFWRKKIVREVAGTALFRIAKEYPQLFEKGVLTAETGQPPFRAQLYQELRKAPSWEAWVDQCPPVLLDKKFLDPNEASVAYLVLDYIQRHPREYLHFMPDFNPEAPNFNYNSQMVAHLPDAMNVRWKFRTEYDSRKARYFDPLLKRRTTLDQQKQNVCLPRLPHGSYTPEHMELAFLAMNPPRQEVASYRLLKMRGMRLEERILAVPSVVDQEICREIVLQVAQLKAFLLVAGKDFQKIKPEIDRNLDVCREVASQLASRHTYEEYQPLITAFVQDIEKRAQEGQLSIEFAWMICQQARLLFSTYFTITNGVQAPVRLPGFLVHAWSRNTRTGLNGYVSGQFKESQMQELTIEGNAESFSGLIEFYTEGKIDKFLQLYRQDLQALGHLWKLADKLLIDQLKDRLKKETDVHPAFLGFLEFISTKALQKFLNAESIKEESVQGLWWLSEIMELEALQKILKDNFDISIEEGTDVSG